MTELIKEFIISPFGSFASIFALLVVGFYVVHYVTKHVTKINTSHESLTRSIGKIDSHIDEMRRDLSYLKGSIDIIRSGNHELAQAKSPVSLTETGIQISKELNVDTIIANNWEKIKADLDREICNKNAYDIQEYCIEMAAVELSKFIGENDLAKVKQFAFRNGNTLQYYSIIFALIIRDKYLKEKGIDISEVDKNDPIHGERQIF